MKIRRIFSTPSGFNRSVKPLLGVGPAGEELLLSIWGNSSGIHRWDAKSGGMVWSYSEPLPGCNSAVLVVLPDDRRILAVATEDGVEYLNAMTGEEMGALPIEMTIWDLSAGKLPDGRMMLVGAGNDGAVYRWDAATGELLGAPLRGHGTTVHSVEVLCGEPMDVMIVSGDDQGDMLIWDALTGDRIGGRVVGSSSGVRIIAELPGVAGRRLFASSNAAGEICRWDAITGKQFGMKFETGGKVYSLATARADGGHVLLSAGASDAVSAWDFLTGEQISVSMSGGTVASIEQAGGTTLLATGTLRGEINLYSLSGRSQG